MAKRMKGTTNRYHGAKRIARTVLAFCSSVPQLTAGGTSPKPRKLRAVSSKIMPGIFKVAITVTWLIVAGIRWLKMMRRSLAPKLWAARTYCSSRPESTRPRTCRARPPHWIRASKMVTIKNTRVEGQVTGTAAPKARKSGSCGKGREKFGNAHHHNIGGTAIISGCSAQRYADEQKDDHTKQPDEHRDPPAIQHPRELISSQSVGTHKKTLASGSSGSVPKRWILAGMKPSSL